MTPMFMWEPGCLACRFAFDDVRRSQFFRHEQAVRILKVVPERRALLELELAVKRMSRCEVWHGSRFQTQSSVAPTFRLQNDMSQHKATDTLPQVSGGRAHGFDLAVFGVQFLQSTATHD